MATPTAIRASVAPAKKTVKTIQNVVHIINERVDDWKQVLPEGRALITDCEIFESMTVGVLDKPKLPFKPILDDVREMINETTTLVEVFEDQDKKNRSVASKIGWKLRRVYLAHKYRQGYRAIGTQLEESKKKIQDILAFWSALNKPTIHWYSGDMVNNASFAFWLEICGTGPYAAKWSLFSESYRLKYPAFKWNSHVEERLRHAACSYGDLLTIHGFIRMTQLGDFPIHIEKLPEITCDNHASIPSPQLTTMLNDLIVYSNSDEFRVKIQPVFIWYHGYDRDVWQDRANEWANEIVKIQGKPNNDLGKQVLAVDDARRTYLAFFQRCMVAMKMGQLREMFAQVDFPSMGSMNDFIDHVKPLDHADYHIIRNADPEAWSNKQSVYQYFSHVLNGTLEKHEEKKKAEVVRVMSEPFSSRVRHEHAAHGLASTLHESTMDDIELAPTSNGF